jgi:hypothetical protein
MRITITSLMVGLVMLIPLVAAACGGGGPEELEIPVKVEHEALDPETIQVKQGDMVTLKIEADHAGEFHLHGYDIARELSPTETVDLYFVADATGRFRITFHAGAEHSEDGMDMGAAHDDEHTCEATPVPGEPSPGISIAASASDEPHHIDIAVTTENIVLSDDGGHWHLFVNGELDGMYVEPAVTFDTRTYGSPGEYQILATLNDVLHCVYDAQATATIVLEGEEPADMAEREEGEETPIGYLEVQPR